MQVHDHEVRGFGCRDTQRRGSVLRLEHGVTHMLENRGEEEPVIRLVIDDEDLGHDRTFDRPPDEPPSGRRTFMRPSQHMAKFFTRKPSPEPILPGGNFKGRTTRRLAQHGTRAISEEIRSMEPVTAVRQTVIEMPWSCSGKLLGAMLTSDNWSADRAHLVGRTNSPFVVAVRSVEAANDSLLFRLIADSPELRHPLVGAIEFRP